jgi:hypothetical protein
VALMCGAHAGLSVVFMINPTHIRPIRTIAGAAVAALLLLVALSPSAGQAAGKTDTLKFFSKAVSFTYTTADGTVSHRPPSGPSQAGDKLEIDSLDYAGTHKKHSKRPKGADYLRCDFDGSPEPDCNSVVALGSSLLRFHVNDTVGAIGRWKSGKVVSSNEVDGGIDIVVKLKRN